MRRSGIEYERMEKLAMEILEDYGIRQYPVDMEMLARKMGFNLVPYSAFEDEEKVNFLIEIHPDGFCKIGEKSSIYYNDRKGETRTNSTIGHEIKHIVELDNDDDEDDLADYFSKVLRCPIPLVLYRGYFTRDELITNFGISYEQSGYISNKVENRMRFYGKKCNPWEIDFLRFVYGDSFDATRIDQF